MVIQPKIRGFICTNAHPVGCAEHVNEQIAYVKAHGTVANGPKNVLVIGASTGYGLASRITAAFGSGANTLGIFFENTRTDMLNKFLKKKINFVQENISISKKMFLEDCIFRANHISNQN